MITLVAEQAAVLRTLSKAGQPALILEEVAATASLSFEQAWYAVVELIELRFMTPAGIGLYELTADGKETARRLIAEAE
jgi:hypothetical protein